ncbi:HBL072Cp [Eremothecium sinecaudum]|uniref:HBL072Cp n=1 Tax=Eremothecium sinecaudum TaxID=45286 RepID=A0A109UWJ4_9SACH|nr:HBL072Cp [Eremothecium sinecaudum]AMD18830.1 HBL072Cp [Eremothecium sinecaudum]
MVQLRSTSRPSSSDSNKPSRSVVARKQGTRKRRNHFDSSNEVDTYGLVGGEASSGRPFQIIERLPCSIEPPKYSVFTQALSVRDSAVLYSSLLASRRTWIKAEMFELYWSKQYMNAKDKEKMLQDGIDPDEIDQSAAREKMHKLSDAVMTGGPHTLPIRMFILKNDEVESKWQDMQESRKRNKELKRQREAEEKERRREARKKQQMLKKEEKLKKSEDAKREKERRKKLLQEEQDKLKKDPRIVTSSTMIPRTPMNSKKLGTSLSKAQQQAFENQKMIANLNMMAQQDRALNKLMIEVANGEAPPADVKRFKTYIEKARNMDPPPNWRPRLIQKNMTKKTTQKGPETTSIGSGSGELPKNSIIHDDSENHLMSSQSSLSVATTESNTPLHTSSPGAENLALGSDSVTSICKYNAVEKGNKSSNSTIFSDSSNSTQLHDTKDSQPDDTFPTQSIPKSDENSSINNMEKSRDLESSNDTSHTIPSSSGEVKTENALEISAVSSRSYDNSDALLKSTPGSRSLTNIIDKDGLLLNVNQDTTGVKPKRKYTKRKKESVEEEDKSMQLTTFQQKYLEGADILFEYLENPNMRFLFPKDAILEPLEDGESYLMSWIVIHNAKEIEQFKSRRLKEMNKYKKKRPADEETKDDAIADFNVYLDPRCPQPLYTPMTVTLSNIHKKFTPIMMNSVNKAEDVRTFMKTILDCGQRLSGYNIWFQLDACDDKDLAESLRAELNDYEQGFKSKRHRKQI